jgi:hypothetical protein
MREKPVFRLPDQVLDSVIYLYQSAADAEAGEAVGGTGFLVGVPTTLGENLYFIYPLLSATSSMRVNRL